MRSKAGERPGSRGSAFPPLSTLSAALDPFRLTMAQQSSAPAADNQDPTPAAGNQDPAHADSRSSKIANLMKQLQELEERSKLIEIQEIEMVKAMDKRTVDFPSRKMQIIAFVKAFEKANQYFELKDHLNRVEYVMHDSNNLDAFKRLVKEDEVYNRFDKLDFQDILDAVKEHISDLRYKRYEDHKLEQEEKNVSPCSKENKQLTFSAFAEKNGGEVLNPLLNLVYSALEKSYVLHEDPRVELDLMKKHNPNYYNHRFIAGLITKCSEKTVFVRNIPNSHDEMRVKASFSACGEVESVILEDFDRWCQVAHVTFKNSVGAKLAPILKGEWCYSVEPVHEYPERRSNVGTELTEALNTYKTLRKHLLEKEGKLSRCRRNGNRRPRPLLK